MPKPIRISDFVLKGRGKAGVVIIIYNNIGVGKYEFIFTFVIDIFNFQSICGDRCMGDLMGFDAFHSIYLMALIADCIFYNNDNTNITTTTTNR